VWWGAANAENCTFKEVRMVRRMWYLRDATLENARILFPSANQCFGIRPCMQRDRCKRMRLILTL
jgi:hypothetical protein